MRKVQITIDPFDEASIKRAKARIDEYRKWIQDTLNQLMDIIAEFGKIEAINRVAHIDTGETLNSIDGYSYFAAYRKKDAMIVAGGAAIWIEFGTGVFHNEPDEYPERPPGIGGIGEYGQGQGENPEGWYYPTDRVELALRRENGTPVRMRSGQYLAHTRGMPQNMFMWNTAQEILRKIPALAKEVF